jgi:hypothetical protein
LCHFCREDLKHVSSRKIFETAKVNVGEISPPQPAGAAPLYAGSIVFQGGKDGETILETPTDFAIPFGQICSV